MQSEILHNSSEEHFKRKYSHGPLSVVKNLNEIYRNEGFRALYKGLSATMVGIVHPIIFFPAYENLKIMLKNKYEPENSGKLSNKLIAASTIIAKVGASLFSYPHEVLRSRL
jgi:solute carrier family 25 (mitochondrial folate transporter), member 32